MFGSSLLEFSSQSKLVLQPKQTYRPVSSSPGSFTCPDTHTRTHTLIQLPPFTEEQPQMGSPCSLKISLQAQSTVAAKHACEHISVCPDICVAVHTCLSGWQGVSLCYCAKIPWILCVGVCVVRVYACVNLAGVKSCRVKRWTGMQGCNQRQAELEKRKQEDLPDEQ